MVRSELINIEREVETRTNNSKFKEIKIEKNSNLIIKENTKIICEKNSNLELLIEDKDHIEINIQIKRNVEINLTTFIKGENQSIKLSMELEEKSKLNHYQNILNNFYLRTNIELKKFSIYNLNSSYLSSKNKSVILNIVDHKEENSESNISSQGIALEESMVVHNTDVKIESKAKKSFSKQVMKNYTFSDKAHIESKPELDIENEDVVCSHSSSISQIPQNQLWYLHSRGLSKKDSSKIFIESLFEQSTIGNNSFSKNIKEILIQ